MSTANATPRSTRRPVRAIATWLSAALSVLTLVGPSGTALADTSAQANCLGALASTSASLDLGAFISSVAQAGQDTGITLGHALSTAAANADCSHLSPP
jgi:hypothetical protein